MLKMGLEKSFKHLENDYNNKIDKFNYDLKKDQNNSTFILKKDLLDKHYNNNKNESVKNYNEKMNALIKDILHYQEHQSQDITKIIKNVQNDKEKIKIHFDEQNKSKDIVHAEELNSILNDMTFEIDIIYLYVKYFI